MKSDSVRTSIDLPRELHRRLHEAAARQPCSARRLILASIERLVEETEPARPRRRLSFGPPLGPADGRKPWTASIRKSPSRVSPRISVLRLLTTHAAMDGKPLSMNDAWRAHDRLFEG